MTIYLFQNHNLEINGCEIYIGYYCEAKLKMLNFKR